MLNAALLSHASAILRLLQELSLSALLNADFMFVTLATSQPAIFASNTFVQAAKFCSVVIDDVSHFSSPVPRNCSVSSKV